MSRGGEPGVFRRFAKHMSDLAELRDQSEFDADDVEKACAELGIKCLLSSGGSYEYAAIGGQVIDLPYDVEDPSVTSASDFAAETDEDVAVTFGLKMPNVSEDFWDGISQPPLYHATTEENAEAIAVEGIAGANETRGLSNRGVGAAVFTTSSLDEAEDGMYGDAVFRIDMAAMKRDGLTPELSLEPAIEEEEWRAALASKLGSYDFSWDVEQGISPYTIIVHGHIPAKYLQRVS